MSEAAQIFSITITIAVVWMLVSFRFNIPKLVQYFKTETGKGILTGIVLAITAFALFIAIPISAKEVKPKYFSWAEVYFGLDYTKNISPQCESSPSGVDDRTTSNLGIRINLLEFSDKGGINFKYTHHSCAFNEDSNGYDAFGFEGGYKFWIR